MNKFENIEGDNFEKTPDKKKAADIDFIRHSVSSYKTYGKIAASENPLQQLNPDEQALPDLPEKGIELAKQEAEKFFCDLDPNKIVLFFASSNEARAIETANIYRQTAHAKGFRVIKPEHVRNKHAEEIGEGEIRVLQNLSIYPDKTSNVVLDSVFNSPKKRSPINWANVPLETKARFEEASKIIEADDKGSFGANLVAHSDEVKKVLPEISTAEELHRTQFQNLLRLAKFGINKAESAGIGKQIKILAFGHENYLMDMLEKTFQEEGIKNCEKIHIELKGDDIVGKFRNKEAKIDTIA
ncbi:MAG: hypothetical protein Q7S09_03405 [bacterium]|nr:hypothetical protein [bacterium]